VLMKELGPTPVPLIVPGEAITEEDVSFVVEGGLCSSVMICCNLVIALS